jgi:hypothetical protein
MVQIALKLFHLFKINVVAALGCCGGLFAGLLAGVRGLLETGLGSAGLHLLELAADTAGSPENGYYHVKNQPVEKVEN